MHLTFLVHIKLEVRRLSLTAILFLELRNRLAPRDTALRGSAPDDASHDRLSAR